MRTFNRGTCNNMPAGKARGFSYVEVLIAMSIAAIALVSLLGLHVSQVRAANHSHSVSRTLMLARTMLDEQAAQLDQALSNQSGTKTVNGARYHWQSQVTAAAVADLPGSLADKLVRITITVTPSEPAGPAGQLSTLVRREGSL